MTKIELQQANTRISAENAALRAEVSRLLLKLEMAATATTPTKATVDPAKYPCMDYRGRRYYQQGNVKVFAAGQ